MKKVTFLLVFLSLLLASSVHASVTFTFSIQSSAYSTPDVLVMKMNNVLENDTGLTAKQMFVWDEAVGLTFTQSTTLTVDGPIRVFAVGQDVKVYKGTDLTNYWLIKSNTSDLLLGR